MGKITESLAAKMIAWVVLGICVVLFCVSVVTMAVMENEGFMEYSYEEVRKKAFSQVNDYNAMRVLKNMQEDKLELNKEFEAIGYRYGIIEADSLKNIDLNDKKNYVDSNFTRDVNIAELDTFSMQISDATYIEITNGSYSIYEMGDDEEEKNYWVVCYVEEGALTQGIRTWNQVVADVISGENSQTYVLANEAVYWIMECKNSLFILIPVSLILGVLSFIFSLCAAGHRKGTAEIAATPVDKIPFDIFTLLFAGIEGGLFFVVALLVWAVSPIVAIEVVALGGIGMGCILLWYFLSISVRVKRSELLRNTVVCRLAVMCGKAFSLFFQGLGMLKLWSLVLFGFTFLEVLILLFVYVSRRQGVYGMLAVGAFIFLHGIVYLLVFWVIKQLQALQTGTQRLAAGDLQYQLDINKLKGPFRVHGENLNHIGQGMTAAVEERMKSERMKTDLITNVSHDIKTPLTSIINYVDLLEKEELQNEKAEEYLEVLHRQSLRLKKLIEDLVEASKASSGNLAVHVENMDLQVMLTQLAGEYQERLEGQQLQLIVTKPEEPMELMADGRHLWRVLDNLMNNICKYAMQGTRVYLDVRKKEDSYSIILRNISGQPLNVPQEELLERFVRGDKSRNMEGHGLGLSIAQSLMDLMKGKLTLFVDGDLFKVELEIRRTATDNL